MTEKDKKHRYITVITISDLEIHPHLDVIFIDVTIHWFGDKVAMHK